MNMKLIRPDKHHSVFFGKYTIPNGAKPNSIIIKIDIEWLVLEIDEDNKRMLLLSKNCLDWEFFEGGYSFFCSRPMTSWDKSTIREMLGQEYYDEWFSENEKKLIIPYKTSSTTTDLLFLLSEEEVKKYFEAPEDATAFSLIADPDYKYNEENSVINVYPEIYWTRTVSNEGYKVKCVNEHGDIVDRISDDDEIGIRPAMWIKYNADE